MKCQTHKYKISIAIFLLFAFGITGFGQRDTLRLSTPDQALNYLNNLPPLERSSYWPNIDPDRLIEDLKTFTIEPLAFYEGSNTNFCSYAALTYLPLEHDPLGFSKFMITLYQKGRASLGRKWLAPEKAVREEAGLLKYKGALDVSPAGQMFFLSLADQFKGYLNIFNRHFHKGDEDRLWASTNYAKFNRMLRRLFLVKTKTRGSDLIRPSIKDLSKYMQEELKKGFVFLFLNNKKLYRKAHATGWISTPTHFVMLVDTKNTADGHIELVYWDYGKKTLQQLSPQFLKSIVYGVTTAIVTEK